ncbi:MAG: roadblock/LC7 domain-containing protein [Candidatus Eremiobacteraeota bacterium]|nr:roadblock/LC7 domain-containing protein [Candidatus Eremiobacteraeota bacterium]
MEEILANLAQVNGIQGALLIGKDGLVIAYAGDIPTDADFIGATICEFYGSAENIVQEKFEIGKLGRVTVEADSARYYLENINNDTFLVTIGTPVANLGLIRLEIKAAAENLRAVL